MKQNKFQTVEKGKINSNDIRNMRDSIELKILETAPEATMEDCAKVALTSLSIFYLFVQQDNARELFQSFLRQNHLSKILIEL